MLIAESVRNPVYTDENGTHITCLVKWSHLDQEHPFGANAWDTEPHGKQLYEELKAGKYGPVAPYVAS